MTDEQALQIQKLRAKGMGYRTIASTVNLSRDQVRNYCRSLGMGGLRAEDEKGLKDRMNKGIACAYCGDEISQPATGRPRRFCSEQCRRNYWRVHRSELKKNESAIYTMECPYCHEIFEAYGNKTRKYCCHEHYILDRFGAKQIQAVPMSEAQRIGYRVSGYTVDRSGVVVEERVELDEIAAMVAKGIVEKRAVDPDVSVTIILFSIEGHNGRSLKNFLYLLYSKSMLLGRAVGRPRFYIIPDELIMELEAASPQTVEDFLQVIENASERSVRGIDFNENKIIICFPYVTNRDQLNAYIQLVLLMEKKAHDQRRVRPIKRVEKNEKYAFRQWLTQLGMVGDEYKLTRRILLQNLKGHTAFREKEQAEIAKEKKRTQRMAKKEADNEMMFIEL